MKPSIPGAFQRAAWLLPAFSLMLAPLAAQAAGRSSPERDNAQVEQQGQGGRSGIIEEINMGRLGASAPRTQGRKLEDSRLISGRVIELKGHTLYVERGGVVVPLDVSSLRISKQPREGQDIIATYRVDRTRNLALSLAGEVAAAQ